MMKHPDRAILSGIGPDRPGIVALIADILYRHDCNIEDSTMTRLADEFAFILLIGLPSEPTIKGPQQEGVDKAEFKNHLNRIEALRADFETLPDDITVVIKAAPEKQHLGSPAAPIPQACMISVAGHDRTGITFRVSEELAALDVNITDLNAQSIPGEDGPVYLMMIEVALPTHLSIPVLKEALQPLATDMNVEIQIRAIDHVAL